MIAWRYALAELRRRPGRVLLSLLSIVIAVAAIVAVTSATATTRLAFQQVFEALSGRADLEVVARGGSQFAQGAADSLGGLKELRTIVPVFHRATIVYAHGKKAKSLAVAILPNEPESYAGFHVVSGSLPVKADEVALEANMAAGLHIEAGQNVRLLTSRGLRSFRVSALVNLENAARLHQGGMVLVPLGPLQRAFKATGQVDALHLYLADADQMAAAEAAVSKVLPDTLLVRVPASRSGLAEETLLLTDVSLNMASALSLTTAVFIVLSVFLMNVGERRRQLSILRAVGATRRQMIATVCSEAALLGLVATLIGIPLGIYGSRFLIRTMGEMLQANLPEIPEMGSAILIGAALGPVICLVAAWYPARKAAQVSPLEGMRPLVDLQPRKGDRRTTIAGLAGLAFTTILAVGAARGDIPIWSAIAGMILALVSFVLLLPWALRPAVTALAVPLRKAFGIEGEMSERLVLRRVGRSSLTIGVLFIAVAAGIGTSNAVFSITDDIRTWYERTITADFLVRAMMPDMGGQEGASMSESLGEEIARFKGVDTVEAVRFVRVEAAEKEAVLVTREIGLYDRVPLDIVGGDPGTIIEQMREGAAVVGSVLAQRADIHAGDTLRVTFGTISHDFRVAAVATEYSFGGSVVYIDRKVGEKIFSLEGVDSYLIKSRAASAGTLQTELQSLADENGLLLQSFTELFRLIDSMVAGVTGGLWILLTLGLLVGALGVVNTLTMNVLEQTRELGMLRAIGMQRVQIFKTVVGQAALLGAIGILGGVAAGMSLARMINLCLGSMFGHHVAFALRPQFIGLLLVVGPVVILLASLQPARRAVNLSVVQAMRQD